MSDSDFVLLVWSAVAVLCAVVEFFAAESVNCPSLEYEVSRAAEEARAQKRAFRRNQTRVWSSGSRDS